MKLYTLNYTAEVCALVRHLHPALKPVIRQSIELLREDPWAGKMLQRELTGLRALRVKHFRIIYRVQETRHRIELLTLGPRKTIYEDLARQKR